ncbi:MAG: glycosyltransferase family 2 protein, partial [Pseudomonadota bacterium]
LGVHRPKGLVRGFRDTLVWVDATGTRLPPIVWDKAWRMSKAQWGYTYATLNHYAVRSAESFLVKRERGKVNRTKREQGLAYWFRMNHNAEEDRSILRFAARVAKEKASLLSLPGVPAAHERAVEWHQARIA